MTTKEVMRSLKKVKGVEIGSNIDGHNVLYFPVSKVVLKEVLSEIPGDQELYAMVLADGWLRIG